MTRKLANTLSAALHLLRLGSSVFPLNRGSKKPAVPWQRYQKERASESQIREWFGDNSDYQLVPVEVERGTSGKKGKATVLALPRPT